jgi:hypothetical protein
MMFVDEYKNAINVMMHPGSATARKMNIGQALGLYYRTTILPLIISVLLEIIIGGAAFGSISTALSTGAFPGTSSLSSLLQLFSGPLGVVVLVIFTLVYVLVFLPIGLFIDSAIYYILPKFLFRQIKGTFSDTFTALVYWAMPMLVFSWILVLVGLLAFLLVAQTSLGSALTALVAVGLLYIILFAAGIWALVVGIIAYANQNRIGRWKALGNIIGSVIVFSIIIFALEALFALLLA